MYAPAHRPGVRKVLSFAIGALAATTISGCVHVAHFATKATDFNVEVSDSQDKTMLLNVLRAANRFPMHFTELTTLSGTGTLTVGGTLTVPAFVLNGGNGIGSIAPTASIAETPTFNVAVLESQEFYKGMLAPLTPDQIANFIDEGVPPQEIYTLLLGSLTYQGKPAEAPVTIENNFHGRPDPDPACPARVVGPDGADRVLEGSQHECFMDVLRALLERHLSIERITDTTDLGVFSDPQIIGKLKDYEVAPLTLEDCQPKPKEVCPKGLQGLTKEQADKLQQNVTLYRLQKQDKGFHFCFDVASPTDGQRFVEPHTTVGNRIRGAEIPSDSICKDRLESGAGAGKPATKKLFLRYGTEEFTLEAQTRSTEGLVYFLGEIARCQLGLDDINSKCPAVNVVPYPGGCEARLFQVHPARQEESTVACPAGKARAVPASSKARISVDFGGSTYWISIDPSATDRSGSVLRVVTQLLALNRSAKDLPAPAVVPIIAR